MKTKAELIEIFFDCCKRLDNGCPLAKSWRESEQGFEARRANWYRHVETFARVVFFKIKQLGGAYDARPD